MSQYPNPPASYASAEPERLGPGAVPVVADVPYYGDAPPDEYAATQCRLDVYRPAIESYPTLVFFHGGGLVEGCTRQDAEFLAGPLTRAGVGVVMVSYRVYPRAACPAFLHDAAAAVAWALRNIVRYGGDAARVFVGGHSAGAYLAAMVGLDARYLQTFGCRLDQVAGLLPVSGQMVTHARIREDRGLPQWVVEVDELAPLRHVRPDAPPTLLIVGENDMPARAEENLLMAAMLESAGREDIRCMVVPGREHVDVITRAVEPGDPVAAAILEFIKTH